MAGNAHSERLRRFSPPPACRRCGEKIVRYRANKRYCSKSCKDAAWEARHPRITLHEKPSTEPDKGLPAMVAALRSLRWREIVTGWLEPAAD